MTAAYPIQSIPAVVRSGGELVLRSKSVAEAKSNALVFLDSSYG